MAYPILASSNTWYKTSVARSTITQINIVDSYTPTGSETESWNADVDNNGAVKCYLNGTVLTIAGNGSGKIAMNADSSYLFAAPYSSDATVLFTSCSAINGLDLFDSSNVTDISRAFSYCISLTELDLSSWDVGSVTTFRYTFASHEEVGLMSLQTLNLNGWNVSNKCNSLRTMFQNCHLLTSIDVSNWDVSNVTDMSYMFYNCAVIKSIDVSNWNVVNVTNMHSMFNNCSSLTTLDISSWNVSNVTDMGYMFHYCFALTSLDVSNWNVGKVTTFCSMFSGESYGATPIRIRNLNVTNWDMSSATDISFMFYAFQGCNLDLSKWNVSKVQNFDHMTAHAYINIGDVSNWYTPAATNMNAMFYSVTNEVLDVSNLVTENVICFEQMFENCRNLKKIIGLEKFNTSKSVSFSEMFKDCHNLEELDLSSFDTSKAVDGDTIISTNGTSSETLKDMFLNMYKLKKITLGEKFSYNGNGATTSSVAVLPTPTSENFADANGLWYTNEGVAYSPSEAVKHVPMTYYATNTILDKKYVINGRTITNICNSIRSVAGDSSITQYKLSDLPEKIRSLNTLDLPFIECASEDALPTDVTDGTIAIITGAEASGYKISATDPSAVCEVSGENITVSDCGGSSVVGLKLYGKTEQEVCTGAQMIDLRNGRGGSGDGVTFTNNGDGSYHVKGTTTGAEDTYHAVNAWFAGGWAITPAEDDSNVIMTLKAGKTYFVRGCTLFCNKDGFGTTDDEWLITTRTTDFKVTGIRNPKLRGSVTYDQNVYPMVAESSTPIPWERYTGGQVVPNPSDPSDLITLGSNENVGMIICDNNDAQNNVAIPLPNDFAGIPVSSGGNYTDKNGQQWICDEIDFERGVYVQRVKKYVIDRNNAIYDMYPYTGKDVKVNTNIFRVNVGDSKVSSKCISNRFVHNHGIWSMDINAVAIHKLGFIDISIEYELLGISSSASEYDRMYAFKAWLDNNPLEVVAQLDEPIETQLSAEQMAAYKNIMLYAPYSEVSNDLDAYQTIKYRVAPPENTMWVVTGTSSSATFAADKNGIFMVHPVAAKQYSNYAWSDKVMKHYKNGVWQDVIGVQVITKENVEQFIANAIGGSY